MTITLDGTNGVTTAGITLGSTAIASTGAEINILDGVTSTAAELNILDGVTATAAEINLIDGGATIGTTAVADGDGILINDGGTMRVSTVQTVKTYMTAGVGGINKVFSQAISTSQTYTVETTGTLVIQATGGGGSGGATQVSTTASSGCATGGGGGGYSYKKIDVEIGDQIVIVIGAGGASKSYSSEPADNSIGDALSGNNGGNTTVDGSNIGSANATLNMDANGGGGGNSARAGSFNITLTASASVGGTATGGDLNYAGGTSIAKTSNPLVNSGILVANKSVGQASGGGGVANLLTPAQVSRTFGEFGISSDGDGVATLSAVSSNGSASVIKFSSLTILSGAGAAMVSSEDATRTANGGVGTRGGGGGGAVSLSYDQTNQRREVNSGAGGAGIVLLDLFAAI